MVKTYFIYRYIRLDKNVPFYIGMGTKRLVNSDGRPLNTYRCQYYRAFSKDRSDVCNGIIKNHGCDIEIIYETNDFKHIQEKEREFISLYGSVYDGTGTLVNLTKGGLSFKTTDEYVKNHRRACNRKGVEFSHKRKVYMYDLDGTYIESFPTLRHFYKKYKSGAKTGQGISLSIRDKISYKGYFFSFEYFEKLDITHYKPVHIKDCPVLQYKDGVLVDILKSQEEVARKFGKSSRDVGALIKKGGMVGGYLFKRIRVPELAKMNVA